jgi:transcriptional regulator with XRE-family HTH domain
MSALDGLLSEFIDAWNAGARPRVEDFLARAAPERRGALAGALGDWLAVAPAPPYDAAARAAIRSEPVLQAVLAATASDAGWPELLPRLRDRAGLALRELGERVAAAVGLPGEGLRTAGYLERMERGELEAARVSQRLLDALGGALGISGRALAEAGAQRPALSSGALFRGESRHADAIAEEFEALAEAALRPAPPPMDELDRLFLGGT